MPTYEEVRRAINDLFNDRSRSLEETLEDMQGLSDEIDTIIECLEGDIENQKAEADEDEDDEEEGGNGNL